MLDPRYIRENTELVRQALADRQDTAPVDEILELNTQRRQKVSQLDNLRQQRKVLSKERQEAQEKGRALRNEIQNLEEEVRRLDMERSMSANRAVMFFLSPFASY